MTTDALNRPTRPDDVDVPMVLGLLMLPVILSLVFVRTLVQAGMADGTTQHGVIISTLLWFVAQDRIAAPVFGGLVVAGVLVASRSRLAARLRAAPRLSSAALAGLAGAAALASWLIARFAFHGYALTLDEFMPQFQAEIFRHGQLLAPIPDAFVKFQSNLQPAFTYADEARGLWGSGYRPVHAALLALMPEVGGISLLNPALTAISVWAMAAIARRRWPDRPEAPLLAILMFLGSAQVLVTAGTGFSYPAHLAFNLVWLALFLKGTDENRWAPHVAAAVIGALAIGLHQVTVHPLFALPFGILLMGGWIGRRVHALPYLGLYAVALPAWILWPELATWVQTGDAAALPRSLMQVHYLADFLAYSDDTAASEVSLRSAFLRANLLRFALWLSPGLLLLVVVAMLRPRRLDPVTVAAAAGLVLTVAVNHLLMANQMQTWGARYYHPVIGNMVVVALAGWDRLVRIGTAAARRLAETAVVTTLAGMMVLMPLRLVQVDEKLAPRARVQAAMQEIDADIVFVPFLQVWFFQDMIRNTPYLTNRPLFVALAPNEPRPPPADRLPPPFRGMRTHELTVSDMRAFGLPRGTLYEPGPP